MNPGIDVERIIPAVSASFALEPGDVFSVRTPGGGGVGNPLNREPDEVLQDLLEGRISERSASEDYGIIVRDGQLAGSATSRLRKKKHDRETTS